MASSATSDRILDEALSSFATRGYEATSLDAVAKGLDLTKQSILYWFPSKDALLEAVIAGAHTSCRRRSRPRSRAPVRDGTGWKLSSVPSSAWRLVSPSCSGFSEKSGGWVLPRPPR